MKRGEVYEKALDDLQEAQSAFLKLLESELPFEDHPNFSGHGEWAECWEVEGKRMARLYRAFNEPVEVWFEIQNDGGMDDEYKSIRAKDHESTD